MYGVRLDLKEEEILEALHEQVKYVKRFKCKHREHNVMRDSSTVPLHFIKSELPAEIKIGYLNFKTKEDIPKPTRFFKCNRFGHVASHCKGKERCAPRVTRSIAGLRAQPLRTSVQIAEVTIQQMIVRVLDTNVRRKSSKYSPQTISRTQRQRSSTVVAYQPTLLRRCLPALSFLL